VTENAEFHPTSKNPKGFLCQQAGCPHHQSLGMGGVAVNDIVVFSVNGPKDFEYSHRIYLTPHAQGQRRDSLLKGSTADAAFRLADQVSGVSASFQASY